MRAVRPLRGSRAFGSLRSSASTWPLPALGVWALAWALHLTLASRLPFAPGLPPVAGPALGVALGTGLAWFAGSTPWRRLFVGFGFPLSLAASGSAAGLPGWCWLVPLSMLAALYPLGAWRDAPLFPTPAGALDGLADVAPLAPGAGVLDAGCGLGAGLVELRRAYPAARVAGIERSRPLAWWCRRRCRGVASVGRGDLWADDWSDQSLVYLFQRPESMARAWAKARREMAPGSWLASLEFEVAGVRPTARLAGAGGRPVWLYRCP